MNFNFSSALPSWPASSAPSIFIRKKSCSLLFTWSRIVSLMFSRFVSVPPVTSSISMMSIPAKRPIPIMSPVSAMHAEFTSYLSFIDSTSGTSPAPRGMIMFAGASPSSILLRFTGWSLVIS